MKTNTLLFLASLAVLATNASAASNQPDNDVVVLPAYEVSVPRYLPAEKKVNASLAELRQQAREPVLVTTEISPLRKLAMQPEVLDRAARDAKTVRVAKL
jgi:hypothetical protein